MGGICPGGTTGKNKKLQRKTGSASKKLKSVMSFGKLKSGTPKKLKSVMKSGTPKKLKSVMSFGKSKSRTSTPHANSEGFEKWQHRRNSRVLPSFSRELKPSTSYRPSSNKGPQRGSIFGRAGLVGLERAVDVLDTLGSSMSNLNAGHSFVSGIICRGNKISILAFEVANTITKGANLMQSLSEENINFLKNDVFYSEGVQKLVSPDVKVLLSIAATDKRDELDVFSREVIRFGDLCKDPQWHNLNRYFEKLDMNESIDKRREEAELAMQELTILAQRTSELYHELDALDRFEQDYHRKLAEVESMNLPRRGESVVILHNELKQQRKVVKSLKRMSLWSKTTEQIVEKLVDIVTYTHQAIFEAFEGVKSLQKSQNSERLGVAGLALHYANVVNQIDNIASRPAFIPPNIRDTLYHGLPSSVKQGLRSRLLSIDVDEKLSVSEVKDEMEKILRWLIPLATNTSRAHQGFGWVGEWANSSIESQRCAASSSSITRLQTLYHADKQKTDFYILDLVSWLHRLISLIKEKDCGFKHRAIRSPTLKSIKLNSCTQRTEINEEDRDLLENMVENTTRLNLGRSKSQEFPVRIRVAAFSSSAGNSPRRNLNLNMRRSLKREDLLDVLDGLDPDL